MELDRDKLRMQALKEQYMKSVTDLQDSLADARVEFTILVASKDEDIRNLNELITQLRNQLSEALDTYESEKED